MEQLNDFCVQNNFTEIWRFIVASEEFLEKHLEIIKWDHYCENPNINLDFISKHLDRVKWKILTNNKMVPSKFLENYPERISAIIYFSRSDVNLDFVKDTIITKTFWMHLLQNEAVPIPFLEEHLAPEMLYEMVCSNTVFPRVPDKYFKLPPIKEMIHFCKSENAPISFLENFVTLFEKEWSTIDFSSVEKMQFLNDHLPEIKWNYLSTNPSVPIEFFEAHSDKLDWSKITINPSIPEWFFEKYLSQNKFVISSLVYNENVSVKFYLKHLNLNLKEFRDMIEMDISFNFEFKNWFSEKYGFEFNRFSIFGDYSVSYICYDRQPPYYISELNINLERSIFLKSLEERLTVLKINF